MAGDTAMIPDRLGHDFAEPALLREALTHRSAANRRRGGPKRSNERLEFLGDRVLGLTVAELLFEAYPDENEGDLTRRQTALVREETLAGIARELGLPGRLTLDGGEESGGGRDKPAILADALEAVIGAVFLDGGYAAASTFVRRHWAGRVRATKTPPRDAKTALQMWALARAPEHPRYAEAGREGPAHRPRFTIEVEVPGFGRASGVGETKREAEKAAAAALLRELGADDDA